MLVQHFLERSAERLPEKVALVCGEDRLTYAQLNRRADRFASALIGLGIRRHDRVVVFLENTVESVISLFGILKAGAIFIMLNPGMKSRKLHYILNDSGARMLIADTCKGDVMSEAITGTQDLSHVIWCQGVQTPENIVCEMPGGEFKQSATWSSIMEEGDPRAGSHVPSIDVDLATIIYTSGSTGMPKGVMEAHSNVISAAQSITRYLENVEDDVILNILPLSFDYGLYQIFMSCLFGGTLVLERYFVYPFQIIKRIQQERATGFPLVPTIAAILLQMKDLDKFDLSSLRYISNTGAALPVANIRKLREIFPRVKIFSMYGLTECKRVSYLPPKELDRIPDSVGIPMPNVEVFVVDDGGQEAGPGETGELVVRGPNVMQGYWNAPEETALTFRQDGFRKETVLYTGDLFRRDAEGYLYFVARKDDLIKTKGERVSPKEVEEMLCYMDDVAEAVVTGVPDDIFGQAIKAFIVPRKGHSLTEEDIVSHCQKNLEPFLVPRYVEFRDHLPKTASGKIDKKQLA